MISAILGQVTGQLEKRFILNAFFPTLTFALACGLALAAGADGVPDAIELWGKQSSTEQVLIAIGAVGSIFLAANLLSNSTQLIIGLFEGYVAPARWLAPWARNRQLSRASRLAAQAEGEDALAAGRAADRLQQRFPVFPTPLTAADVAPTRLGNVLLSAETYPMDRYGVDAVRAWPRLYPLLPETMTAAMVQARTSMEFLLAVSFLAGLYAPLASVYLIATAGPPAWIFISLFAPAAISAAAYFAALGPAYVYGQQVRAAFDLHRFELLRGLAMPFPATLAEERRAWDQLTRFLERGVAVTWRYVPPEK